MVQRTYERVVSLIKKKIEDGDYKPLSRLPAERELASHFDVSRTTVREALLALEAARLIEIRDRSGAYVMPNQNDDISLLQAIKSTPGPYEVLQMRRLIEGEACFLVASNASEQSLSRIVQANQANAAVPPDDTPEFHEATRAFHMSIAHASENSLFPELLDFLWEQKSGKLWEGWYRGTRSLKNRLKVVDNNQEITDALTARRPQAARTAMQYHIDWMIARFLSY